MPLIVPVPASAIGDEVWTRTGRALDPNNPTSILTRVGDPTGHTLATLVDKLGDGANSLLTLITLARMAELDPANMPADLAAILAAVGAIPTTPELEAAALTRYNTLAGRIGDPAGHTLTSLIAKLGDPGSALDQAEFEQTYSIDNQTPQHWNDVNEHTMTTLDVILVEIPSGATRNRETLLMLMDIMALEAPGGVQKIDVQIEARKAGGAWTVAWTEDNIMSLPDVDGARDSLVMIADSTGLFDGAGTYEFRAKVQASLAKDTQYLYTGLYSIRYKMG